MYFSHIYSFFQWESENDLDGKQYLERHWRFKRNAEVRAEAKALLKDSGKNNEMRTFHLCTLQVNVMRLLYLPVKRLSPYTFTSVSSAQHFQQKPGLCNDLTGQCIFLHMHVILASMEGLMVLNSAHTYCMAVITVAG